MADKVVIDFETNLAQFRKELDQVKAKMGGVGKKSDDTSKKVQKNFKETETSAKKLETGVKGVGKAIAGAFAIHQIVTFAIEASKLAREAQGIEKAFSRLNRPDLLNKLRVATKGAVTDIELMKSAVKANNFKIPLDQLGKLFSFASARARDTGESVDYLTESIVLGISRKSIPILDNLGLSATEIQQEFKKTGDFAVAVGNIIDREMTKGGDAVETFAEKTDRLNASFGNAKLSFGKFIVTMTDAVFDVADIAQGMADFNKILNDDTIPTWDKFAMFFSRDVQHAAAAQVDLNEKLKATNKILKETPFQDEGGREAVLARMRKQQIELSDLLAEGKITNETYDATWMDLTDSMEVVATKGYSKIIPKVAETTKLTKEQTKALEDELKALDDLDLSLIHI